MKLPNAERAVVEIEKLVNYSLNPDHPVGKHKARVFRAALGITVEHADWLRGRALEAALTGDAIAGNPSAFGETFVIDELIEYGRKSALIRFTWILEHGKDYPRMTSCYVK